MIPRVPKVVWQALAVIVPLVVAGLGVKCYGDSREAAGKSEQKVERLVEVIERVDTLWLESVAEIAPRIEEAIDSAEARSDTATRETLLQCRDLITTCDARVAARDSLIEELQQPGPRLTLYGDVLYRVPLMRADTGARIVVRGVADVRLTEDWSAVVEADATSRSINAGFRWRP